MSRAQKQTPWNDYVALAESISQSVADSLTSATGSVVELGKVAPFEPEDVLPGRPVPVTAIVVTFRRPLRDVLVFLTSLKADAVRSLVEAAADATIASLDVPTSSDQHGPLGQYEIEEVAEFETIDHALEQCDALYLEATYALEAPNGELRMVIGTGLLESANCFVSGVPDPYAVEAPVVSASSELELGDQIGAEGLGERYELGDDVIGDGPGAGGLVTGDAIGATAPATGGIDAYDSMLAAQAKAEADAAAAIAGTPTDPTGAATAMANAQAAGSGEVVADDPTERWTELLSGVEVELSAELGRTDLALGDITSLAAESVLTLDQLVHEPVDVYVNGTRYATARLVVVDGEYGIEILEVVEQDALPTPLAA